MAKAKKKEPTQKHFKEKVKIDTDFHETMRLLAIHANTKGTKKITYKDRSRSGE